jgi:hypothetical protein
MMWNVLETRGPLDGGTNDVPGASAADVGGAGDTDVLGAGAEGVSEQTSVTE